MIVVASGDGKEIQIKPKIFINGFPKAGLHLTELMVTCLAKPFVEKTLANETKALTVIERKLNE